jgi:hypothetical protein
MPNNREPLSQRMRLVAPIPIKLRRKTIHVAAAV